MREIKFRAWNKEQGRMLEVDSICMSLEKVICKYAEYDTFIWQKSDKFELMQYTGLKDKNGKEIYEGDIVKSTYGKCRTDKQGLTRQGTVVYDKKTASFKISIENSAVLVGFYDVNVIEVLGNVYEELR